jgi:hypothetical protein
MISLTYAHKNQLLAKLPQVTLLQWLPKLEKVEMPLGEVLQESEVILSHVYFPISAIVSLQYVMKDGSPAEIVSVGDEGMVGIAVCLGGQSTITRAQVKHAGEGIRVCASLVKKEFDRASPALHVLLSYIPMLISQISQTLASNSKPVSPVSALQKMKDVDPVWDC